MHKFKVHARTAAEARRAAPCTPQHSSSAMESERSPSWRCSQASLASRWRGIWPAATTHRPKQPCRPPLTPEPPSLYTTVQRGFTGSMVGSHAVRAKQPCMHMHACMCVWPRQWVCDPACLPACLWPSGHRTTNLTLYNVVAAAYFRFQTHACTKGSREAERGEGRTSSARTARMHACRATFLCPPRQPSLSW